MFQFFVKPSSGGTKNTFITHPMLLLPLYLYNIFVSECNLHTKILYKCNGRNNIGCVMNVVLVPPEDDFT
jgi:hypothetical protein